MSNPTGESQYLELLENIRSNGHIRSDRTGTGTISLFAPPPFKIDVAVDFPLLTTKKMFTRGMIHELLWFISGSTNIAPLEAAKVHFWNEWADEDGNLGPVYGAQLRDLQTSRTENPQPVDQLRNAIVQLMENPTSRRIIITLWNPQELDQMNLPPCHGVVMQFYVDTKLRALHLYTYQRSADAFLGLPVNIASYSLLLSLVARVVGLRPGVLTYQLGDAHIYSNHIDQVGEQLSRTPYAPPILHLPTLQPQKNAAAALSLLEAVTADDIRITGYEHHAVIKAPVSV